MRKASTAAGAAVLWSVVLTGCGGGAGDVAEPGSSPTRDQITVRGTVEPGVEQGCVVLRTDGDVYELRGDAVESLPRGKRVEVTGVVQRDVASYCMQGIPLKVVSAEPAT